MEKKIDIYIYEIQKSIELIEKYTQDIAFEDFCNNEIIFDACCMRLQHIWECWVKIWKIKRDNYKWIPFVEIGGFRNRISHDYIWIDDNRVWDTIQNDLPKLKKMLEE